MSRSTPVGASSATAVDTLVRPAGSDDDYRSARELFVEYATWLDIDLCFQGFNEELDTLPGKYAPPNGRLFLAFAESGGKQRAAGCVAIRPLQIGATSTSAELKRLWVRDAFRGLGLGQALTGAALDVARDIGYRSIKLDTLPQIMPNAVAMYRSFGFVECDPYYHNPVPGTMYMERAL